MFERFGKGISNELAVFVFSLSKLSGHRCIKSQFTFYDYIGICV